MTFFAIDAIVVAILAMAFFAWASHRRTLREKEPQDHADRSPDGRDAMSS
jgi:hypothetical protein